MARLQSSSVANRRLSTRLERIEQPGELSRIGTPLRDLVRLARPLDWAKSAFIFLPVPFALTGSEARFEPVSFLLAVLGFCLISSTVYILNDLLDAPTDRLHPTKRFRPIAAGRVTSLQATLLGTVLATTGVALLSNAPTPAAIELTALYGAMMILYCVWGKHQPLIDVGIISAGFVLRAVLGCVLLSVTPSNWLLLCSGGLALLLALGKRRADFVAGLGAEHRASLGGYSLPFLDQAMGIAATLTLISYALYTLDPGHSFAPGREMATLPFVTFGIFYYLRLAQVDGDTDSPMSVILRSGPLQLTCLGWLGALLWSIKS